MKPFVCVLHISLNLKEEKISEIIAKITSFIEIIEQT